MLNLQSLNLTATRRNALVCLALVLATVAVYWPVWFSQFLSVDDQVYVSSNLIVQQGLTWTGIKWAFGDFHVANYHPITWLSHMLDCQLFGLDSRWHHATNLLIHCINVVLVYLVLKSMTGRNRCSAVVAALFALHPVHVESVAWVSERKDVLSAMFMFMSLAVWTSYVRLDSGAGDEGGTGASPVLQKLGLHGRGARATLYAVSLLLFTLGLFSKAMLVTMPAVLLLLDVWPLGRTRWIVAESLATDADPPVRSIKFLLLEKIPFAVLSFICAIATMKAQAGYGAVASTDQVRMSIRFGNAAVSYARYLRNFVWPAELSAFYPLLRPWPLFTVLVAVTFLAVTTAIVVWQFKKRPQLSVGWFFFLGTLVPVIGLVQVGNQAMADRYMYIPMLGLSIIAVWTGAELYARAKTELAAVWNWHPQRVRRASMTLAAVTLMSFAALTAQDVRWWHDTEVLFTRSIEMTEPNVFAMHNLGCALMKRGANSEAIAQFERCAQIQPQNPYVRQALGYALLEAKKPTEALQQLKIAIRLKPDYARTWNTFGHVFASQQKWEAAADHFAAAIDLDKDDYDSYLFLAAAKRQMGQADEALADLESALKLGPYMAQPWHMYGTLLIEANRPADAVPALQRAIALEPTLADAHLRLGIAQMRSGHGRQAIEPLMNALKLEPNSPEALAKLGWLLSTYPDAKLRRGEEALALAERANQLSKSSPQFLSVLAAAYAEQKQFPQAAKTAREASELAEIQGDFALSTKLQAAVTQYRAGEATRDASLAGADVGEIAQ